MALRFLETEDSFERSLIIAITNEVQSVKKILDKNLAIEIANAVGKLFSNK